MTYQSGEKLKQNKAAFTLIEMVTSISLIVMITGVFIANYNSNNKRSDLIMTAQKLVADIHMAQNNALGLVKYGTNIPPGGWGIHFNLNSPRQYTMFADLNRPENYEIPPYYPAEYGYMRYDTGEGLINQGARVINLPQGVEIISLITDSAFDTSGYVNVTFLPPNPKTNIFNGMATSTALSISLRDNRSGTSKTVRVNFLGLVEVID